MTTLGVISPKYTWGFSVSSKNIKDTEISRITRVLNLDGLPAALNSHQKLVVEQVMKATYLK